MRLPSDDLLLPGADPAGPGDDFGGGLLAEAAVTGALAASAAPAAVQTFDPSAYPCSAVVFIADQINGQTWRGSRVLVTPDEVLTAARIAFDGGLATNIDVAPAYDGGDAPFGHATGTVAHYSQVTFDGTMTEADA